MAIPTKFFTLAVLEALRKVDSNGDGVIKLSQLVLYVRERVSILAKVLAEKAHDPAFAEQTARFGSKGEDFVLVKQLH